MNRNNNPFNPQYFRNRLGNLLTSRQEVVNTESFEQISNQKPSKDNQPHLENIFEREFLGIKPHANKKVRIPIRTADSLNLLNTLKSKITGKELALHASDYSVIDVRIQEKKAIISERIDSTPIRKLNQKQLNFASSYYEDDFVKSQKKVNAKPFEKELKSKLYRRPGKRRFNFQKVTSFSIFTLLIFTSIYLWGNFYLSEDKLGPAQIAGASESLYSSYPKLDEYKPWIIEKNSSYSNPDSDLDSDGLNNYEEFILDTNPKSPYTCDTEKKATDSQNLMQLIDPLTCKKLDLENKETLEKFQNIIDIPEISKTFFNEKDVNTKTSENKPSSGLLQLFGVQTYSDVDKITSDQIQQELELKKTKIDYLNTIKKIDDYIKKYRSYDSFDRNYPTPVSSSIYLDVSLRYNVPLKYTLAIARNESRFGTDSRNGDGGISRIGQYKNIFSIGLTDSSSSGFNTWEDGVEAWGKWYQKFQSKGVSDCTKWKIFNPNGEYCSKIESLANQIDIYLKS